MFVLACGITFPVAMLPLWAQLWAKLMPPTYIVDDIRRILLHGDTIADVAGDVVIVMSLAVLAAMLAVVVFRYLETSARRTGMLGRFCWASSDPRSRSLARRSAASPVTGSRSPPSSSLPSISSSFRRSSLAQRSP